MQSRLLLLLLALTAGCDTTGAPTIDLLDGGPPMAPDAGTPGRELLAPPADPRISASFPALEDPPAEWSDPPECPSSADPAHCETCWSHGAIDTAYLDADESGDAFGTAIAVGDFNGDGYPDLAVGAPDEDWGTPTPTSDAGRVYVYLGSSRGFQPWLVIDDPAVGAPQANARFGANLLRIDLDDADDFDDLVIAYGGSVANTPIYVLEGQADGFGTPTAYALSTLDVVDGSTAGDSELGFALATGDFDDDGDEDLAVGAPHYQNASTHPGAVFRLTNTSGTLAAHDRLLGPSDGARFGHALAAGDVDGAFYDFLVVGAPGAGQVVVYDDATPSSPHTSAIADFGRSLLVADLVAGGGDEVVAGGTGSPSVELDFTTTLSAGTGTPAEVRPLAGGDLDGDTLDDLVLLRVPTGADPELYLFQHQISGGPSAWSTWATWSGRVSGDELGASGAIQDLDGDGLPELLAGATGAVGGDVLVFSASSGTDWATAFAPTQTVDQETALATCDECTVYARVDGSTECGDHAGNYICFLGTCRARGCGDGWREPGPTPARENCDDGNTDGGDACDSSCGSTQLLVSSRTDGVDAPSSLPPAVAEDGLHDLLFVYVAEGGTDVIGADGESHGHLAAVRTHYGGTPYAPYGVGTPPFHDLAELPADGWDAEASVAGLPTGGWWVVWTSPTEDGAGTGIAMRFVDSDGTLGPTRVANQTTLGEQSEPRIAALSDGFVVVWTDASGMDGPFGSSLIKARRFDAYGSPVEDEWIVSDPTATASQAAVAAIGDLFLVAYALHPAEAFELADVVAQRFGPGTPDTAPFTISDTDGSEPALAVLDGSTFLAAWTTRTADRWGDVESRTIPTTGAPPSLGSIQSFGDPEAGDSSPSIAPYGDGYIVAWEVDFWGSGVAAAYTASVVAGEADDLGGLLSYGLQADVTLLTTFRGTWFAWSDAHRFGTGALRSFVAYLLPGS
ncbi:MAG: FG-GAP repeat protein [Myxococcales bacterium]|nr:FG-GAP repeat protein [Myxococcales bacterium]